MTKKKKKKAKNKVGRPKRDFTPAQVRRMGELALVGCQTLTIASIMGIPRKTIDDRPDIRQLLTKKRANRKLRLRKEQNKSSRTGNVTMQIWLGKQVLDQKDKQDITSGGEPIRPQIVVFGSLSKTNDDPA